MELYRYIPFDSFVDIIQSKSLCFVYPPVTWKDSYEGYAYRAMQTEKGRQRICEILETMGINHRLADMFLNEKILSIVRYQCWTRVKDNVALWSIYSFDSKAIMISTTSEKLEELGVDESKRVKCVPMKYVKSHSLEDEIRAIFKLTTVDTGAVFHTKRSDFEHECEVRAFVGTPGFYNVNTPLKVPISDIHDFIDGVMVHPSAPSWYVETVENYCMANNITFLGQSKLYKFES